MSNGISFSEKNMRRMKCRNRDPELYKAGRRARKDWARGGAFGRIKSGPVVAACELGTERALVIPTETVDA